MDVKLNAPWLVAVWPGMGGIAQIAGSYLVEKLGARQLAEVQPEAYFDVQSVQVSAGLIRPHVLPKSRFYGWKNASGGPDLVIFIGEEQPRGRAYRFCNEMLSIALELGVTRVITFAAMATPMRPEAEARVFAAASRPDLLEELGQQPVELLREALISGLNGVLLAAAADRGVGGICLLGEFPYFARAVANPKAAAAVLRAFANLAGISLDLSELDIDAAALERVLSQHLERLERAAELTLRPASETVVEVSEDVQSQESPKSETDVYIETLFMEAKEDRSKALELKAELDRRGLFSQYEDRFLDLFNQGE